MTPSLAYRTASSWPSYENALKTNGTPSEPNGDEPLISRKLRCGYELSPLTWGQGYATEAARAIVRFGFRELRLHRIWAWCNAANAGSARVLAKLRMRQEGRLRDKEYFKGRWWDTLIFAILEDEWRAAR